jgi:hypothetical protein
MVIISILLGLLIAGVFRAREASNRLSCQNHLKQIGLGIHCFHDGHGYLPPNRIEDGWATWSVLILSYLDQSNVYQKWHLERRYHLQSEEAREVDLTVYFCPSQRSSEGFSQPRVDARFLQPAFPHRAGGLSDYAVCIGNGTGGKETPRANGSFVRGQTRLSAKRNLKSAQLLWWRGRLTFASITDGLSNTLFVGEKFIPPEFQTVTVADSSVYNGDHTLGSHSRMAGKQLRKDGTYIEWGLISDNGSATMKDVSCRFGSLHSDICNFLLGDGSVRAFAKNISLDVLDSLSVRNDGHVIPDF